MEVKLFDSERKVMEVLWDAGEDLPAREIARRLEQAVGWNKNTTYTVIKKCIAKGAIARSEPHFLCHACVSKEEVQADEAEALVGKLFGGAPEQLFAALLSGGRLSKEQLQRLKKLVEDAQEAP